MNFAPLFTRDGGYVKDLLRNYGNRGEKMNVPQHNTKQFQAAMQFRERERSERMQLQSRVDMLQKRLHEEQKLNKEFAGFIVDNFSNTNNDNVATDHGRGSSDSGGGQRDRVVPAVQGSTAAGEAEQVAFSKPQVSDEPSNSRGSRSGDDVPDVPRVIEEVGGPDGDAADAGGSDSIPGPRAPDARRQGSEHESAE